MQNSLKTLQNLKELGSLLEIYKKLKPQRVLEIGVKNGGTLWYWMQYSRPAIIVAVDDCRQEDASIDAGEWANEAGINLFKFIKGDSHSQEVIDEVNSFGPYDFVFIDGDHAYEGVKKIGRILETLL